MKNVTATLATYVDGILALGFLFGSWDTKPCRKSIDVDDDGRLRVADALFLLNGSLNQRSVLRANTIFFGCAVDRTPDAISCEAPGCSD